MMHAFVVSYVALWGVVVFQSLLLVGLVRLVHGLQPEPDVVSPFPGSEDHLPLGHPAPPFSAHDTAGRRFDVSALQGARASLLFISPDCKPCRAALRELPIVRAKATGEVVVICQGGRTMCAELTARYELEETVIPDEGLEITRLFGVGAVPVAVLLDEEGRVRSYGHPDRELTRINGDVRPAASGVTVQ